MRPLLHMSHVAWSVVVFVLGTGVNCTETDKLIDMALLWSQTDLSPRNPVLCASNPGKAKLILYSNYSVKVCSQHMNSTEVNSCSELEYSNGSVDSARTRAPTST